MSYSPLSPRARIGAIIPSENCLVEPEFRRYLPADIEPFITRLRMSRPYRLKLTTAELIGRVADAAALLGDLKCDVTVLQCTGTTTSGGVSMDQDFVKAMSDATGKPATTTGIAITAAFKLLGVKRLAFITRMDDEIRQGEATYIEEAGFEIIGGGGTGAVTNEFGYTMPPQFWYDKTMAMREDRADAYFITCANARAIEVIEPLERDLGRPVITSNQAALWHALRIAGIDDTIDNLGTLFRMKTNKSAMAAA